MKVIEVNASNSKVLHQPCEPVNDIQEIQPYIDGMKELLFGAYNGRGKGLAAPQVGVNKRFFILRFGGHIDAFINPKVTKYGNVIVNSPEGCLSVPGKWFEVKRSRKIEVSYLNEKMFPVRTKFSDFNAIAFQHELDHLSGKLICDIGKEVEQHVS
jgi:peptide deformylase